MSASRDEALWRDLGALLQEGAPEAAFLRHAFEAYCQARGAIDAGLYRRDRAGFRRCAEVGSSPFPEILTEPSSAEPAQECLPLPGGLILLGRNADTPITRPDNDPDPARALLIPLILALHLEELRERLKRQNFQANYRGVELEALYDVGLAITRTLDLEQLTDVILLRAVSLLDARRGALYHLEGDRYHLRQAIGGEAVPGVDAGEEAVGTLLTRGHIRDSASLLPGAEYLSAAAIAMDGVPWGLLVVGDKERRHGVGPFSDPDRRTLALFGHQAAIAIENAELHRQALEKERLERDMELAAEIQGQLLPDALPQVPGFSVVGWNRPARQVGGDYYDVRRLDENRLLLALGDVTGKGMPAALLVSTLHSALRLMTPRLSLGPEFLERLNDHLLEISPLNKFITLVLAELEVSSGRLLLLNAGHNPGLLLRAGGGVEELPAGGPPLGLLEGSHYRAAEHTLRPGDLLCIYSDGLTEATRLTPGGEEEFGPERLAALLEAHRHADLARVRGEIEGALRIFTAGEPQGDDQTLILVRREP